MADSDRAWRRWAELDPYFGVFALDRFRRASFAAHREEFWHAGRVHVDDRLALAKQHFGPLKHARALDFGCGVGRLTLPLAQRFDEVLGLDIAPAMLEEAERNAREAGLANLAFALSDDALSAAEGQFDFVMSCIVFQHVPVRRGLAILRRLLDRVADGGVASVQLCIDRRDTAGQAARYWAQRHVPGFTALLNLMRGRPAGEPLMQMNAYPQERILSLSQALGFDPPIIETHLHGRFLTAEILMHRVSQPRG
ncbi:MAG: methyltransferase domain-containing protein [Sphingomonadales bacterium]|nr:methyltransferase domain-containing protein [Sphingomonadales bacterium]